MNKLLIIFLLFFSTIGYTQSSLNADLNKKYVVIKGSENINEFFIKSFEKADWDKYRLQDDRRELDFDNNIVIELLSAAELSKKSISYDARKIISGKIESDNSTLFVINSNGHIIEQKKSISK